MVAKQHSQEKTMRTPRWIWAVPFVLAGLAMMASAQDVPPVFSKVEFDKALEANKSDGKILIVKATAVWCGPCKQMDKTTWRDEKIVAWVGKNAVAIQIDVDKQKAASEQLKIEAMPTMVAFKAGKEIDRVVGFQQAGPFLTWMEGLAKGETSTDKTMKKLDEAKSGESKMSAEERLKLAKELAQAKKFDEATSEYVWLWDNIVKLEPGMVGVRVSFMAGDMEHLAARHALAKAAFTKLRDATAAKFESDTKRERIALGDWIVLNRIIDSEKDTLAWFDKIKATPEAEELLKYVSHHLDDLLLQNDRWSDLGKTYRDPVDSLKRNAEMRRIPPGFPEDQKADFERSQKQLFQRNSGRLYAALLAAGRDKDAADVAGEAIKLDDSAEMKIAMVQTALRAKAPRKEQLDLLAAAEKSGANVEEVRKELTAALEEK
ncbi:MAG: thioredoxin family protein [Phycisphaerae bacterium]